MIIYASDRTGESRMRMLAGKRKLMLDNEAAAAARRCRRCRVFCFRVRAVWALIGHCHRSVAPAWLRIGEDVKRVLAGKQNSYSAG